MCVCVCGIVTAFLSTVGLAGVVIGAAYGAYRSRPIYVYSLSLGVNMSVVAVVFFGVREVAMRGLKQADLLAREESYKYASSTTSGGVTGLVTASAASEF